VMLVYRKGTEASTAPFSRSCRSPSVFSQFRLQGSQEPVYALYKRELPRAGWRFFRVTGIGDIVYRRRYDGWDATLSLSSNPPNFYLDIWGRPAVGMTPE